MVAAHECKSMNPFPELMVSFIGMLVTAHKWYPNGKPVVRPEKGHLAPTLFVGGSARAFYNKMIAAMQSAYNLNIVVGMHAGTWNLREAVNRFTWGKVAPAPRAWRRARSRAILLPTSRTRPASSPLGAPMHVSRRPRSQGQRSGDAGSVGAH